MPQNWKTYKLSEIAEIGSSKRIFLSEYVSSGVPFYRSKEVIESHNKKQVSTELFISNEKFEEIQNKFSVPVTEDILLTSVGTIGVPFIIPKNYPKFYFKDGNLTWFKNYKRNLIEPKYLYFIFTSEVGQHKFKNNLIGSTQQALTISSLREIEITLPPLPEQTAIASILSSLDDKIELNLQMNKTLEEMAMALYKHWFVDFGPFKDGEFVESELGMIPKGWEIKKIDEFGAVICGKTPSKKDELNYSLEGYPFIKIPDMHGKVFVSETSEKISEVGNKTQLKKLLPAGSVNVSCIATVGLVSINALPAHTNQQINSIKPFNKSFTYYLYLAMINLKDRFLNEASGGSATLNMNTSTFSSIKIIAPNETEIIRFDSLVVSIFEKIRENLFENQTLTFQRDFLLPKLISGEIRVKDSEQLIQSN